MDLKANPGAPSLARIIMSPVRIAFFTCVVALLALVNGRELLSNSVQGQRIYVDADASGAGDGSNWEDAYVDLQAAIAASSYGDEIWVAEGTYKPTTSNDREIGFAIKNGTQIFGGFAGHESSLNERHWWMHETILSGDIGTAGDPSDNSFHVIRGDFLDSTTVLDGLTVRGGRAFGICCLESSGGGAYFANGSPLVRNLKFVDNQAQDSGGGVYNYSYSEPTFIATQFISNTSTAGGGMLNFDASPTLIDVTFQGNRAIPTNTGSQGTGGGMYNGARSRPILRGVLFLANEALAGGGMYSTDASPIVTASMFVDNRATYFGGGAYQHGNVPNGPPAEMVSVTFEGNQASQGGALMASTTMLVRNTVFLDNQSEMGGGVYGSPASIKNSTFVANIASDKGGGLHGTSLADVVNSIFWDNSAPIGPQIYGSNGSPILSFSLIQGGYSGTGNIDLDPEFISLVTGDLRLSSSSPAIDAGSLTACPDNDRDGYPRPLDGDGDGVAGCDMGAYEYGWNFHSFLPLTSRSDLN